MDSGIYVGEGGLAIQTFLPYPDFRESLRCLDPKRLGNQVYREVRTLFTSNGWPNHPVRRMWRNHLYALATYGLVGVEVLAERGLHYPHHHAFFRCMQDGLVDMGLPPWIGGPVHASHRSNLLRKDYVYYSQFGWTEPDNLPYVWPL